MSDLLKPGTLDLFLFFVVPGFVSISVYDLLVPSGRWNLSESAIQIISFSMLNVAIWYWAISSMAEADLRHIHPVAYNILMFGIIVVSPALLAIATYRLRIAEALRKFAVHPSPTPWDFLFGQRRVFWILFHLKSGQRLGGYYSTRSFTSSFPNDEEIYVECLWRVDESGQFLERVTDSAGALVRAEECHFIELFEVKES
jgi:hypothetical protein